MQELSVQQLIDPGFAETMYAVSGDCVVVMSDKSKVVMPVRLALVNGIFWSVYAEFGHPINKNEILWIDDFRDSTATDCGSIVYRELVLRCRQPHLNVLSSIWKAMCRLFSFVHRHCREYQVSIDWLSLCEMCNQPKMLEVCNRHIDEKLGTKAAEEVYAQITKDLLRLLSVPGEIEFNPLRPFMDAGVLNKNQLPQMFCAYGPRADITDEMKKHVINSSAMSGLTGIEDFAIEYLSAKKAQFSNTTAIEQSQYTARKCRLGASRLPNVYEGWCGSQVTIPFIIQPHSKHNFLGKYIKVTPEEFKKYDDDKIHLYDDCSIMLTKKNIDYFVGREVQMWSPFGCRHTDGFCEHCAGYMNQKMTAFVPPGMQIGVYSATHFVSRMTQKILSAKHLIKTNSIEFVLGTVARKYLSKNSDVLFWQSSMTKWLQKYNLRIQVKDIGTVSDLQHENLPGGRSWSKIGMFSLVNDQGNIIDSVELTDGTTYPYFSGAAMEYMRKVFNDITVTSEFIDIPLKGFDFHKPIFKYTTVNDDMMAYVDSVKAFLSNSIGDYRSIPKCINDFSELVFTKTDINIFYIEVMLRAFLISKGGVDHSIPVIEDPLKDVEFDKMGSMISESALSTKLAFERLSELFIHPEPTLKARGSGYGFPDPHFNFGADIGNENAGENLRNLLHELQH